MPRTMALADVAAPNGLISGPFGSNLVAADYTATGVPVIRGANMGGSLVSGEFVFVSLEKFERDLRRCSVRAGDVVFTQRGTLGQVAVVPESEHPAYVVSQSQMGLRVDQKVADTNFVYYACSSQQFLQQIDDNAIATGVPHINLGILSRLEIPQLPVDEQRAIAYVLSALDEKIAANKRVSRSALALADALFEQAYGFTDERTTIGELADRKVIEFGDGYRTKRSEHGKPGMRILRAGDVRHFQVMPAGDDFVSADYSRQIGGKASQSGDVIMTTKGTVGRVAVVGRHIEQVVYSPQICYFRIRNADRLGVGCLAAWFRSADLTSQTASLMYKSDMAPYINLRDIRSLSMPVLEPAAQRRQSELQGALLARFDACCVENERLARARDELLPLLMSGRLRVKDAEAVASELV